MRPILEFASDGEPHGNCELVEHVCAEFQLDDDERRELLPSGTQTRIANRVGWAKSHLKHAGLVRRVGHGVMEVTPSGRELLDRHDGPIHLNVLNEIPAHDEWFRATRENADTEPEEPDAVDTPEERIESLVEALNQQLRSELLTTLRAGDPFRFEQVVLDLLLALGYGGSRKEAATVTKRSNDGGIDGVINDDRLGLEVIYVQAKKWGEEYKVGRTEVQAFVGALAGKQANKGVFITTSGFSTTARDYAAKVQQKIILIDGERLASLMIDHGVGVSDDRVYRIKRVDSDYFEVV